MGDQEKTFEHFMVLGAKNSGILEDDSALWPRKYENFLTLAQMTIVALRAANQATEQMEARFQWWEQEARGVDGEELVKILEREAKSGGTNQG